MALDDALNFFFQNISMWNFFCVFFFFFDYFSFVSKTHKIRTESDPFSTSSRTQNELHTKSPYTTRTLNVKRRRRRKQITYTKRILVKDENGLDTIYRTFWRRCIFVLILVYSTTIRLVSKSLSHCACVRVHVLKCVCVCVRELVFV